MAFTDFDELLGSPTFDFAPDHSRAMRTAYVSWSNIADLLAFVFPGSGFGPPVTMPGYPFLVARSLHVEPIIGEKTKPTSPATSDLDFASVNTYDKAKVRIEFETPPYQPDDQGPDPQLLLQHRLAIGGEFLTIDSYGLKWVDGGLVHEDVTAGKLLPLMEHQMTWQRVEHPPFAVIRDRIGCVNNTAMTFKTGLILPETLLFLGAELRRDILTNGALAWEVVYRFSERNVIVTDPSAEGITTSDDCEAAGGNFENGACEYIKGGWNHFYRSEKDCSTTNTCTEFEELLLGKTGFYRLQTKSGGDIYEKRSFAELFVQES